ncbi:MAG: D-sedoheptulose 7-phosphate isomerase [Bacteroidetes bacterium]|nr:D-sedoheptulose 7-phosphate isomerase [Bacteroidota bacterium]
MNATITEILRNSIATKEAVLADGALLNRIEAVVEAITHAFQHKHKVLFCGNGGSAADAQHLSAEFSGRFYTNRPALPSEALHCNTSYLTAVANDFGFDLVYSRMVQGMGQAGDVLVALSTSGNSQNILNALEMARELGMITIGMTGSTGGKMKTLCDILINIPSTDTPRIQECHITVGHIICQLVEAEIFKTEKP